MMENNILDADEDLVDTVEFDVTITGVPPGNAMTAYTYTLLYPSADTRVIYRGPPTVQMIWALPPGYTGIPRDPVYDTDGTLTLDDFDSNPGSAESGNGVLDRLRIETTPAPTTGMKSLYLINAEHADTEGLFYAPEAIDNAILAVNSGACSGLVDIEMVGMSLTSANPIPIGVDSTLTVDLTVRNNGPGSANTDANTTFTVPSDCILNGSSGTVALNAALGVLSPGATVNHQETPALRCTSLGSHQMPVTACGQVDDLQGYELIPGNECATQNLAFDVVAPPGTDSDGDGVWDLDEFNCGVPAFGVALRPEALNGFDDDGDTQVDEPLPTGAEAYDCDGDGWTGSREAGTPLCGNGKNDDGVIFGGSDDLVVDDGCPGGPAQVGAYSEAQFNIGLTDQDNCGGNEWAADLAGGDNKVTLADVTSFTTPPSSRRFGTSPGDLAFDSRWDLNPGPSGVAWITLADITQLTVGSTSRPAMLGGTRAFGGLPCGPIGCTNAVWCTVPSTPAGVALRLETDRLVYHTGEPVEISLIATNTGGSSVTLVYPSNCPALFWAGSDWFQSLCFVCQTSPCSITVPAGGSITYSVLWNQIDGNSQPIARGEFVVRAALWDDDCTLVIYRCPVPVLDDDHVVRLVQ